MMKSIVVYHSTSGNTKKIAEAIHTGMSLASHAEEQSDIARVKDVGSQDLVGYDLIGLGGPVMHGREIHNLTHFVERTLETAEGKHGFAFCTHGATPDHFLWRVVPLMMQRGLTVIGWNDWFGAAYHPGCPKPYFTDGHPDAIDLKEAEDFGIEMVMRSRRIYQGETTLIPTFPRGREYEEIYEPLKVQLRKEGKEVFKSGEMLREANTAISNPFKVNMEKCNYPKCTFCIDNCPMDAIDFSQSPPVFNIACDRCWLCEMTCPQGAIEFDWEPFLAFHQIRPGKSVLEKSLELFEARGHFRRLVPLKDIGWDTPFAKLKKPRYKFERGI